MTDKFILNLWQTKHLYTYSYKIIYKSNFHVIHRYYIVNLKTMRSEIILVLLLHIYVFLSLKWGSFLLYYLINCLIYVFIYVESWFDILSLMCSWGWLGRINKHFKKYRLWHIAFLHQWHAIKCNQEEWK